MSRMSVLALAGLVLLSAAGSARADAAFPPFPLVPDVGRVWLRHVVSVREPLPDHVFILRNGPGAGYDRAEFVTIEPGQPLVIDFDREPQWLGWAATLFVVPRDGRAGSPDEVLRRAVPGTVTSRTFKRRSGTPAVFAEALTIRYEVRHADGRPDIVRTSPDERLAGFVAPLLVTLAAVLGGLYLVRRWLRPTRKPNPLPPG